MKRSARLLLLLLSISVAAIAAENKVLEIGVRGMICAFCVEGLRHNLTELPGVSDVQVSLKHSRARIEISDGYELDLDVLRRAIVDAGFTPGDVNRIP